MYELTLTEEQEAAIVKEHGSLDYIAEYVSNYANYLLSKQTADEKMEKVFTLFKLDTVDLDKMVVNAKAILEPKIEEIVKKG